MQIARRERERVMHNGWPWVLAKIQDRCDRRGLLLDDFVDASYDYSPLCPTDEPWVGIFHHPPEIESPLQSDARFQLLSYRCTRRWLAAKKNLVAAVAMTQTVADGLRHLGVPVVVLRHPTRRDVTRWRPSAGQPLVQVGTFLRDTRAVLKIPACRRERLRIMSSVGLQRDSALYSAPARAGHSLTLLDWPRYDSLMSSCVVVTRFHGAAASNVVVECIERCTPLVVNRLPAVVEYLGEGYPLYYDDPAEVPALLERAADASDYLSNLPRSDCKTFLDRLEEMTS